eukprot:Em0648g3a
MCEDNANLKVFPPIHRFGNSGRWIRAKLLAGILHGTPVLLHIQNLRTPRLNMIMKMVSFLGEEEFYTPLVAAIVWLVDARLGRLVTLLMALGFYLAGATKNFLCLPRPPSPVVPLERCNDWALPSHHAVLSVNVPWYIWFYTYLHSSNMSSSVLFVLFFLTVLWSFSVMFSRMYLGVHSPADIVVGGILGCLLLAGWLHWDLYIDWSCISGHVKMAAAFLCKKVLYFNVSTGWFRTSLRKAKSVVTSEKIHYSTSFVVWIMMWQERTTPMTTGDCLELGHSCQVFLHICQWGLQL